MAKMSAQQARDFCRGIIGMGTFVPCEFSIDLLRQNFQLLELSED